MLIPEFTNEKENKTLMYFPLDGRKTAELMDSLECFYPGFSEMKEVTDGGKKYICVYIDFTEF